jgi:deazaflavin-dependent oxidoreductase (nitroreductase family)
MDDATRTHNPFISSATGGRVLSAAQLPFFRLHPPSGYGVLTTTGRKTGKARSRCLRAIKADDAAYLVAIKGAQATSWAQNALSSRQVQLQIKHGSFAGCVRELGNLAEKEAARDIFCETVHPFDYLTWVNWRRGHPTPSRIRELLNSWFETGTPLVVDLAGHDSREEGPPAS